MEIDRYDDHIYIEIHLTFYAVKEFRGRNGKYTGSKLKSIAVFLFPRLQDRNFTLFKTGNFFS